MVNTKSPAAKPSVAIRAGKDSTASHRSNSASAIVMGPEARLTSEPARKFGTRRK